MDQHGPSDGVVVVPPLVADPLFVEAVEDAVAGGVDSPELQPHRTLNSPQDFASLYIRHRSSFELHARRFHSDFRDVDEVVQETFLRLFLAMPEIENELQAISFGRRVLTNLCIDRYRADRRRPRLINLDDIDAARLGDEDFEDPVLRAEDAAIVREALALLSPLHRAALIKREIEEKPLAQIAAELDVPEENVKHLLYRARRALRRLLVGTSVQPDLELSPSEVVRLANKRMARATLRSANVLIAMFVLVTTVVGGLRVTSSSQSVEEAGVGGGASLPAAGPLGEPQPPATPASGHAATGRRGVTAGHAGSVPARPSGSYTQRPAISPRVAHKPVGRRPGIPTLRREPDILPGSPETSPLYKVTGSIRPTGPVGIANQVRVNFGTEAATSVSNLVAPIGSSSFVMQQALVSTSTAPAQMQLTTQVQRPSGTTPIAATTTSTAVQLNASSLTYSVSVTASLAPTSSTVVAATVPQGVLHADLTYDVSMRRILAETVSVQGVTVDSAGVAFNGASINPQPSPTPSAPTSVTSSAVPQTPAPTTPDAAPSPPVAVLPQSDNSVTNPTTSAGTRDPTPVPSS